MPATEMTSLDQPGPADHVEISGLQIKKSHYSSISSICLTFLEDTFPQIKNAKLKGTLILWILAYILSGCVFYYQMRPLVVKYRNHETLTELKLRTSNHLDFPAVTVCNPVLLKRKNILAINKFGSLGWVDVAAFYDLQKLLFGSHTCDLKYKFSWTKNIPQFDLNYCNADLCYPKFLHCDGVVDCPVNETDEQNCIKFSTIGTPPFCSFGFQCPGEEICIWDTMICDGHIDCNSGWDEDPNEQGPIGECELRWCSASYEINKLNQFPIELVIPSDENGHYLNDLACNWDVTFNLSSTAKEMFDVTISCADCLFANSIGDCSFDYISIRHNEMQEQRYCPNFKHNEINVKHTLSHVANGDIVYIAIKSDSHIESSAGIIVVSVISQNDNHTKNASLRGSSETRTHSQSKRSVINREHDYSFSNMHMYGDSSKADTFMKGDWRKVLGSTEQRDKTDVKTLALFPKNDLIEYGIKASDLIIECTFDGKECSSMEFEPTINAFEGVCHTFNTIANANKIKMGTSHIGSNYGLKMTVFLPKDDSIGILKADEGGSVSIASYEDYPNPGINQVSIMPGFTTQISLRKIEIKRKPSPYSDCMSEYPQIYDPPPNYLQFAYNYQTCRVMCIQDKLIRRCNCTDDYYYGDQFELVTRDSRICNMWNKDQKDCRKEIYEDFSSGKLDCNSNCFEPCFEYAYNIRVSYKPWPQKWFLPYFIKSLYTTAQNVRQKDISSFINEHIKPLIFNISDNLEELQHVIKNNFARIEIFYENLNYETYESQAVYDLFRLVADFGGNIGLWIGWSILVVVDVIEAIVELIWFQILRQWRVDWVP